MVNFLNKLSIQKSEVITITPRSSVSIQDNKIRFSTSSTCSLVTGDRLISSQDIDPELTKVSPYVAKVCNGCNNMFKTEATEFITKIRKENIELLKKENLYEKYRKEDTSWFYELRY